MGRPKKSTEERRREIAEAALGLAIDRGAGQLTTAAIAAATGLAEGTVFRHFASKDEIVLAAIARLDEILRDSLPVGYGDPLERLGAFFGSRVTEFEARPGMARLLLSDDLGLVAGEPGLAAVRKVRQRSLEFVRACLAEAHARDLLRPGIDPEDLVLVVQGAALALVNASGVMTAELPPSALASRIWHVLRVLMER
ncbi:MAG: TetR/AcrR family transcriptional regulator [Deltaproteobacteria bacterium]|nr:MAG: TetR/AcrR family transcriptional regulator [Deltaproteobacteria bacterium]